MFLTSVEVEDSAALHRWHVKQGATLNAEMMKVFKDKVIGFPTLMGGDKVIQPVKEKIILGIDPGTNIMGYGVLKVTGVKPEVMTWGLSTCVNAPIRT